MHVPLDDATPEPAWPDGVSIRTVRSGEEWEVHALVEDAFADAGLVRRETLAVRRSWRRHGLGRALLPHSSRELAALGGTAVGLSVDAENPIGAVRLYESVGMPPVSRRVLYEKRLSGASAL